MKTEVVIGDLRTHAVEAAIRTVSSQLEPITPLSREMGLAAGDRVLGQLQSQGEFPIGGALITPGGGSAASYLIHIVIQSADEPVTPYSVQRALLNGLRRAAQLGITTLALPPIGTGAGNLEAEASAAALALALEEHAFAEDLPGHIQVVVASEYERAAYAAGLEQAGLLTNEEEPAGEVEG